VGRVERTCGAFSVASRADSRALVRLSNQHRVGLRRVRYRRPPLAHEHQSGGAAQLIGT